MSLSLYEVAIPTFLHTLESLKSVLEKAVAHAEAGEWPFRLIGDAVGIRDQFFSLCWK